jgi:replication factor C subunit 3/5
MLWVDKYRPHSLDKLELHPEVSIKLQRIIASGDFPHVLLYGPSGAGKKTRILAALREMFGAGVEKIKVTHKSFKVRSKTIEISTMMSNYHIELNPSDVGINDRLVVQEVIKEIASTHSVGHGQSRFPFKVVVLNEVDRLSKDAQHALRRTMEKYMSTCRLILCCESACRVAAPLKSRCLPIRIPSPTPVQIHGVLKYVAKRENLTLPDELGARIAMDCQRNVRKAVLMLEAARVDRYPFAADQKLRPADWQKFIDDLAYYITEQQSPERLLFAREKMYELLTNCIPADIIFKTLSRYLLRRVDDQIRHQTIRWAAHYEHRLQIGSKAIFHLEAFVAKFMAIYKRWIAENM